MSIESDSEFFEVFKIGGAYHRKHYSLYNETGTFYGDMGYAGRESFTDDFDFDNRAFCDTAKIEDCELIEFVGDVDFDDNNFSFDSTRPEKDIGSSLSYDYEMDVADAQNLDEQIKSYVADLWEFVSIIGDRILFRRLKGTSF